MDDQGRKKAEDDLPCIHGCRTGAPAAPALIVSGSAILCGEGGGRSRAWQRGREEEADDLLHDADCGGDFDAVAVCDGGDDEKEISRMSPS